jgi:hypothetical protein
MRGGWRSKREGEVMNLEPGQTVLVGHDEPSAAVNLDEGESVTITAVPEPEPEPETIEFRAIDPTDESEQELLANGDIVIPPFAVKVEVDLAFGSVKCFANGTLLRTENNAPIAPFGDQSGDYAPANVPEGPLVLKAEVFEGKNATGAKLDERQIALVVQGDDEPPPDPEPEPGDGPSGIPVPPVKAGWKRVGFSHFDDDIPFGQWNGDPEGCMMGRATGIDTSKRGKYSLAEISQHDGVLDSRMRVVNGQHVMGCPMNKAPNPSNNSGTAPKSLRTSWAMKITNPAADFKIAHMTAKYGKVRAQEIDWPENRLDDDAVAAAWLHLLDGGSGKHFKTKASLYDWHLYTTEFVSGKHVLVELDGIVIGSNMNPSLIGKEPVHHIVQNETAIGVPLTGKGETHCLIDFVTIDVPE